MCTRKQFVWFMVQLHRTIYEWKMIYVAFHLKMHPLKAKGTFPLWKLKCGSNPKIDIKSTGAYIIFVFIKLNFIYIKEFTLIYLKIIHYQLFSPKIHSFSVSQLLTSMRWNFKFNPYNYSNVTSTKRMQDVRTIKPLMTLRNCISFHHLQTCTTNTL